MSQDTDEWTGDEAYEHMSWCEAAVKKLRELPEDDARAWWKNDCEKPDWLEIVLEETESVQSFADRLELEEFEWAETASARYAEEKEAEEEEKWKARRTLERSLNWKRYQLEQVRLCQQIPEAERVVKGSKLAYECGYLYLMKQLKTVRYTNCIRYEDHPDNPHKIGATRRAFKKRRDELWREKRLLSVAKYATVVAFELEKALHLHFEQFRIKRGEERQKGQRKNKAGEKFRLPAGEVAAFKETVAKVEKWVLLAVEARLELEILRVDAVLLRSQP